MSGHIKRWEPVDLNTKTDRELILLTAQRMNDIAAHLETMNGSIASTRDRVRTIEDWKNRIVGGAAVLMLVVPAIVSYIVAELLT